MIAPGHKNNVSKITRWGTIVSQNGIPFIIGSPHGNKLHYFDLELMRSPSEISDMAITMVSCDYTLWHRRMGHTHQHVIKHQEVALTKSPPHPRVPVRDVKRGNSKGSPSQLQDQGHLDPCIWFIPIWMNFQFTPSAVTNKPQPILTITHHLK